jgi:predicted ester cyclase
MRAPGRPGDAVPDGGARPPFQTENGMLNDIERRNLAAVQRFIDEYQNRGDLDAFHALMHPEFVDHSRPPHVALGPEGVRQQFDAFRAVLTGFHAEVVVQVAQDDLVATHKVFSGVHTGAFLGIAPSGERVELPVSDTVRLRDGRIIEHWGVLNIAPLLVAERVI